MTIPEYLTYARAHALLLRSLLREYHPVNRQPETMRPTRGPGRQDPNYITAWAPERACVEARKRIRSNFEGDPILLFNEALLDGDWRKIHKLLNDAWFGVPESTSCWSIPGFSEAVHLMDDPPEEEEA